jgi:hypothetical protein
VDVANKQCEVQLTFGDSDTRTSKLSVTTTPPVPRYSSLYLGGVPDTVNGMPQLGLLELPGTDDDQEMEMEMETGAETGRRSGSETGTGMRSETGTGTETSSEPNNNQPPAPAPAPQTQHETEPGTFSELSIGSGLGSGPGFVGCMRHLQVNGAERLLFQDAIGGRNVGECDVPACSYSPCHNHGTCQT